MGLVRHRIWSVPAVVCVLALVGCSADEPDEDGTATPEEVASVEAQGSGEGPAQDDQDKADEDQAGVENEPDQDAEAEPTEDPDNPEQLPQVTPPGTELSYGDSMIVQVPVGVTDLEEGWAYLEYTVTDVVDGDPAVLENMSDAEEYEDGSVAYVHGTITVLAKYGLGIDGLVGGAIGVIQSDGMGGAWPFGGETYEDCTGNFLVEGAGVGDTVETCHIGLLTTGTDVAGVMYYGDSSVPQGGTSDDEYWHDPIIWQ